jgi:hypothetical protein
MQATPKVAAKTPCHRAQCASVGGFVACLGQQPDSAKVSVRIALGNTFLPIRCGVGFGYRHSSRQREGLAIESRDYRRLHRSEHAWALSLAEWSAVGLAGSGDFRSGA